MLTYIDADGGRHMMQIGTIRCELAEAGFAAGCVPRLGAGLDTVGATSLLGIHFSPGMSPAKCNLSPKAWPILQVP